MDTLQIAVDYVTSSDVYITQVMFLVAFFLLAAKLVADFHKMAQSMSRIAKDLDVEDTDNK